MATTTEQRRRYNIKYRHKVTKIKHYSKELDQLVAALEKLPKCPECKAWGLACLHTPAHKHLERDAELTRGNLRQLDH